MGTTPPADATTVIRYMLEFELLDFNPGTQYQYSNLGYCILGRVIEKVTGQSYEDFVRNTILLPLNITDMRIGYNLESNQLPLEVNYYDYPGAPLAASVYDNVSMVPWPYGGFNVEAMDAHGGWVCSAAHLVKLLCSVDGFASKPDILLPATINRMVNPSATNANYALGWSVNNANNWWHTGSLPGTTTEFVRANNEMNWAILLNTRPSNPNSLSTAVDALVWNVIPTIVNWPAGDQFTSVDDKHFNPVIKIYPNPTTDKFIIQSDGITEKVEITNLIGETLSSKSSSGQSLIQEFDLSNYPAGIYFIRIKNSDGVLTNKIIKQ
jgi:CubicO group peptidase (beta-lactamase class C family)